MDIQQIEQFIAGAEEIDRKRKVISRIIRSVVKKLPVDKQAYEGISYLAVSLGEGNGKTLHTSLPRDGFVIIRVAIVKPPFSFEYKVGDVLLYETFCNGSQNMCELPLNLVQPVYKALPEFVEQAYRLIPSAGIKEYFDEIIAHAPTAS